MSIEALRAIKGQHVHQLMGVVFDEVVEFDDFRVEHQGQQVGDGRAQVWSLRYEKFLTMVMMKRDFLADHDTVEVNGVVGKIVDLPFDFSQIT